MKNVLKINNKTKIQMARMADSLQIFKKKSERVYVCFATCKIVHTKL